jgi:hypothetical protein|tara:strand:+ start:1356 stop:1475 length:120 start_codon:yes stop_codon:yes gene_type:complete
MEDIRPPKLEVYRDKAATAATHGKYNSNFSKQGLGLLLK